MCGFVSTDSLKNASFSGEWLADSLAQIGIGAGEALLVAFSGGLDSTVLLHALSRLARPALRAVHIDHGLQPKARAWGDLALQKAAEYGVACEVLTVKVRRQGQGWEAAARTARYEALASCLRPEEVLLVAHHANDQAETVLLQLLRGAGLSGAGGMVPVRPFAKGRLARPLLGISRAALAQYAAREGLSFVTDESNADTRFARNYVRETVWPLIANRWPKAHEALARGARLGHEAHALLEQYLALDVRRCTDAEGALLLTEFCALSSSAQSFVLRAWIQERGGRAPSERSCNTLLAALRIIPRSRLQVLRLPGGGVLRRYRDRAFWGADRAPAEAPGPWDGLWDPVCDYPLPGTQRRLVAYEARGQGLGRDQLSGRPLVVKSRVPGARVLIPGRGHRPLKKLLQELGIAPWERAAAVFVFDADALIAIPGYWVCDQFRAGPLDRGLVLTIETLETP